MNYKQIDEQFDRLSTTYVGQGGWCCVTDNEKNMAIWPYEYKSVKDFIHQIYDQAKAEGYQEAIEDMNEDKAYKENKL